MRVELGESEMIIREHTLVESCVVAVRDMPNGNKVLVGYVKIKNNDMQANIETELKMKLRKRLPIHMIPIIIFGKFIYYFD